jgi:hypothetical protein
MIGLSNGMGKVPFFWTKTLTRSWRTSLVKYLIDNGYEGWGFRDDIGDLKCSHLLILWFWNRRYKTLSEPLLDENKDILDIQLEVGLDEYLRNLA